VGPPRRQQYAAIAALALRSVDAKRDILLQVKEPLTEELMEVLEQLRVTVQQMPFEPMVAMEWDFGMCCFEFWACWMKLLTWRETRYAAVMNIDTDFLALRPMDRAFDIMAENAASPFDVGGTADPVVAAGHAEAAVSDVFNGGMFIALPSREGYEAFVEHAHSSRWLWGEMLWLNTFATKFGHWVRLPVTMNLFPSLLAPGSPLLPYGGVNWDSIYGLHFAGVSKVTPETTAAECRARTGDCVECCLKWVAAAARLEALVAANKRAAESDDAARDAARQLPPAFKEGARAIVRRNRARGFTFDKEAYHDGLTGKPWSQRGF
jgi:hypothetical protein